jgi:hypothetical protein
MSKEVELYRRPTELTRQDRRPSADLMSRMDILLEHAAQLPATTRPYEAELPLIVNPNQTQQPAPRTQSNPTLYTPVSKESAALPRACSSVDQPVAAYYVHDGRRYRYARSGQLSQAVYQASFCGPGHQIVEVPGSDIGEELCPYCGTSAPVLFCDYCKTWICRSKVVNGYAWCRKSCGAHGPLIKESTPRNIGMIPRVG